MNFFEHPGRYLFTGKSKSGKTTLAVEIIRAHFHKLVDRIIIICPTFDKQSAFDPIRQFIDPKRDVFNATSESGENIMTTIFNQLKEQQNVAISKKSKEPNTLILIDDIAGNKIVHGGRHGAFPNLAIMANHYNASMFVLSQQPKAISPAFRDNLEGVICFPTLKEQDRKWLYEEYNGCMLKQKTFMKLVKQAWKGPGNDHYNQFGEHFLFIVLPPRAAPRYFTGLTHELFTTKSKLKTHHE